MNDTPKHMTTTQKRRLIEILSCKKRLRLGKFCEGFTKKDAQEEWKDIAKILNALPGPDKSWQAWRKSWQDLLCKRKRRKMSHLEALNKIRGNLGDPPLLEIETNNADPLIISGLMTTQNSDTIFEFNTNNSDAAEKRHKSETDLDEDSVLSQIFTEMKEKVEIKKQLSEAKMLFYTAFIENMQKQTAALEQIASALHANANQSND